MNRSEIQLLQKIEGYPCVTITLPTHRTSRENRQDPVRVKNLLTEATNRLVQELGKREADPVLKRLDELVRDIDFQHMLDGLALFANRDFARAVLLPFSLKERVVVDRTFLTRDLVFAANRTPRYWVLVLSEKPTRLYEATRDDLQEIRDGGFPMTHEGPGGERPLPDSFRIEKSTLRDEHRRSFFRRVNAALKPFIAADPLPIVITGVDRFLSLFQEVTDHHDRILASVKGSHDKTPPHELAKLVWPLAKDALAEERRNVLHELEKAVGENNFVSTVGEVWRLAREGRGKLLLVEEDFHYPARVDASGTHLEPAEDISAPDVIDDAVDEIIETVLAKNGRVVFADNGQLEAHQRIALILRY